MLDVQFVLKQILKLSDEEIALVDLKPGDRVKVQEYDSDPDTMTVKIKHQIAVIEAINRRYGTVTVKYVTGPAAGKRACVAGSCLKPLTSAIDALGATATAGERETLDWDDWD